MTNENFDIFKKTSVSSLLSAAISLGVALGLTLAAGAVVYVMPDPLGAVTSATIFVSAVTFFVSGVIGGVRGGGFVAGFLTGILLWAFFVLISLFFSGEESTIPYLKMPYRLIFYAAEPALAALGAYLASRRARKRRFAPRVPKIKHK